MTTHLEIDDRLGSAPSVYDVYSDQVSVTNQLPMVSLPLSSLGPGIFLRQSGTDIAHVQLLADAASFSELPAILVQKHSLRIIDGMHRIEAAKLRGEECMKACFVDCSDEEAFLLAVKANTLHGLPLSRADRIAGGKRILEMHGDWSDRAVAASTGLSAKTIAGLRRCSGGELHDLDKRLGRDGKRRPVAGIEGRKRAAEYLAARPDASVREVAREADVSLGTVHDVRSKLRRGLDPTAGRRSSPDRAANGPVTDADRDWSPARNGTRLATRRPASLAPSWPVMAPKLANDPAIRYAGGGREFFRWMSTRIMQPEEWKDYVDAVPPHWAEEISLVAEGISTAWRDFACQLRARQRQAV